MKFSTAKRLLAICPETLPFDQLCKYRSDLLTLYWGVCQCSWSQQYLLDNGYLLGLSDHAAVGTVPKDAFLGVNVSSAVDHLNVIWRQATARKGATR